MIAVLDKSTLVGPGQAQTMARACAHQLRYDAAPAWGLAPVPVVYYSDAAHVSPGAWMIVLFDDPDQAGVLGWHSEGPDGLPYGRVFAKPVIDAGGDALTKPLSVASVLSHEVLEAFVDSACNRDAEDNAGHAWALEVCDPVESDSYAVAVSQRDGTTAQVTVSDFVTPAWFDPAGRAPFSFLRKATAAFRIAPGGYAIRDGQAVWGEKYPAWRRQLKEAEFLEARRARAAAHDQVLEGAYPIGRSARRVAAKPAAA